MSPFGKLGAQRLVVIDNSVMDDSNRAVATELWVRVRLCWCPVSGPSRVADADRGPVDQRRHPQPFDTAGALRDSQLRPVLNRDAGRVVATIGEPLQGAVEQR